MISMYTGAVGSGKSYHGIELGLDWIKKGKNVIANFPIKAPENYLFKFQKEKWQQWLKNWEFEDEITVEYLMAKSIENGWMNQESSCLVIIDEAGILFNSRDWMVDRQSRTKWIKFLSQSRKFGYDFIFICQSDRMIDRQIRGLVEYDVKHLKANNAIFFRWLSLFKITMFMYVYKWYQTRVKGNVRLSFYRKSVGDRYDTMRVFNLDDLIESMLQIYEGKLIPASVAVQIQVWEDELKDRLDERKAREKEQREKEEKIEKEMIKQKKRDRTG